MSTSHQVHRTDHDSRKLARGLGWFSIGLGLAELLMPDALSRVLGMPGSRGLIRACGVREVVTGVGILLSDNPRPWIYGRIGGDALDLASLGWGVSQGHAPRNAALAATAVAGVAALDVVCAKGLSQETRPVQEWDYSDRSGFPRGAESVRGLAEPAVTTARAHPNGYRLEQHSTLH